MKDASIYVSEHIISVQLGTKCIDGRYLPDQSKGMIARPGADLGYVLALLAVNRKKNLGLSSQECFKRVFDAVVSLNGSFYFHSDTHADPADGTHHGLIGCGHVAKASKFPQEYGVEKSEVVDLVSFARASQSKDVVLVDLLQGNHQEKGILVIHDRDHTISSFDQELQRMYFIYDVDRDSFFLNQLAKKMNIPGVNGSDLQSVSDKQLQSTISHLAPDLPVYDVTFEGENPQVRKK